LGDYQKIFKAYDIRGIVPDELDERVAEAVGAAFARLTGARSVVTVHDMRSSSVPLAEAFGRGAAAQGADVIAGGLGSTDMAYYASGSLDLPGATLGLAAAAAGLLLLLESDRQTREVSALLVCVAGTILATDAGNVVMLAAGVEIAGVGTLLMTSAARGRPHSRNAPTSSTASVQSVS